MLPISSRIPRALFSGLSRASERRFSPHFMLLSAPYDGVRPRVAASVSKKVSKKAVIRNRTRRRMYAALTPFLSTLTPKLILISAKPGAEKLSAEVVTQELAELLKKR